MENHVYDFIVIGSGISGLTAAQELQKKGYDVLVLEAQDHVGGRLFSAHWEGNISDTGAQFFSEAYPRMKSLIHSNNLKESIVPGVDDMGFGKKGKIHQISPRNPLPLSNILSLKSMFKLFLGMNKIKVIDHNKLEDITYWVHEDKISAAEWSLKNLNQEILEFFMTPIISSFNYSKAEETSSYLGIKNLTYTKIKSKTYGLKNGLNSLALKMASDLNVKLNERVKKIENGKVITENHSFAAKKIIIATTASSARFLLPLPQDFEKEALNISYGKSVVLCLSYGDMVKKVSTYGNMIVDDPIFNVLTIERFKNPSAPKPGTELIQLLTTDDGYDFYLKSGEEKFLEKAKTLIEKSLGIKDLQTYKIFKWNEAIPQNRPGRAQTIAKYRKSISTENQIFLAGDFMGTPCSEGAVESGLFVSGLFVKKNI